MSSPYLKRSVGDWVIDTSWDVYGADNEKVGRVDEVHPHYLVVGKGLIFHREHYIPISAITNVERECVYLNVSASEINERGWDRIPDLAGADAAVYDPNLEPTPNIAVAG